LITIGRKTEVYGNDIMIENGPAYASFLRRMGAYLIDLLFCVLLLLPLFIWYGRGLFSDKSGLYLLGYSLYLVLGIFLIRLLYLVIGWSTAKGTIGCRAMRIMVVTTDSSRLSVGRSCIRYLALLVSAALFGMGWITILLTPRRQAIHDYLASTIVLDRR
jgi:uncharacterized RDD family membrane protein YckC